MGSDRHRTPARILSHRSPRVSRYRLTETLGAGTDGEVWKGEHAHEDQRFVIIKLLQAHAHRPATHTENRPVPRALARRSSDSGRPFHRA